MLTTSGRKVGFHPQGERLRAPIVAGIGPHTLLQGSVQITAVNADGQNFIGVVVSTNNLHHHAPGPRP